MRWLVALFSESECKLWSICVNIYLALVCCGVVYTRNSLDIAPHIPEELNHEFKKKKKSLLHAGFVGGFF